MFFWKGINYNMKEGFLMRKILSIMLILLMVVSVSSCNSGDKTEQTGSDSATIQENDQSTENNSNEGGSDLSGELTYVSWNTNQEEQNRATIEGFNKLYPNVKINLSYTPWDEYWNKLEAAASGGELPDLITMHTNTIEMYVNNEFMEDLTDLNTINPDFSYDDHPEDVKKLYRFNDKMWGVPKDFDCIILVYNKELFDAKGVEYPTDEWTWEDLENAAKQLTDKDNGVYGFGAYNSQQDCWGSFLYQNGGGILTEDSKKAAIDMPESIEAMEWWMNMYKNYSPPQSSYSESDPQTVFASGTVAMHCTGNWNMNHYTDNEELDGKWDIVALPHPASGEKATLMNGLALSVSANSKNKEAAKAFAAYFGTEQGQLDAAMGPSIPCYNGISDKWAELNKDLFNTDAVLSQMQYGKQWIGTESKTQWNAVLDNAVTAIYNDDADIESTFKEAAAEINKILEEEQSNKK